MASWIRWGLTLLLSLSLVIWAGDDRGIGGTGKMMGQPADAQGDDRGIGGTGVIGTITEFGSIWVNGLEIELDEKTNILRDGRPASELDLRLGQQVAVLATQEGGQWWARVVRIQHAVIGEVVESQSEGWLIQGVSVVPATDAPGALPSLALGQNVRVSGYFIGDQLYATDIETIPKTDQWQIVAPAQAVSQTQWRWAGRVLPEEILDAKDGGVITLRGRNTSQGESTNFVRHERLPFAGQVSNYLIETPEASLRKGRSVKNWSADQLKQMQQREPERSFSREGESNYRGDDGTRFTDDRQGTSIDSHDTRSQGFGGSSSRNARGRDSSPSSGGRNSGGRSSGGGGPARR